MNSAIPPNENPQQPPKGGRRSRGRRSRRKSMKGGILVGKGVPMGGRRRSRRSSGRRMRGGEMYSFGGGPYVGGPDPALADGNVRVPPPAAEQVVDPLTVGDKDDPKLFSGGRRSRKASRKSGKMSPWLEHVMAVKKANPSFSLGDAMKAAKKTYKK